MVCPKWFYTEATGFTRLTLIRSDPARLFSIRVTIGKQIRRLRPFLEFLERRRVRCNIKHLHLVLSFPGPGASNIMESIGTVFQQCNDVASLSVERASVIHSLAESPDISFPALPQSTRHLSCRNVSVDVHCLHSAHNLISLTLPIPVGWTPDWDAIHAATPNLRVFILECTGRRTMVETHSDVWRLRNPNSGAFPRPGPWFYVLRIQANAPDLPVVSNIMGSYFTSAEWRGRVVVLLNEAPYEEYLPIWKTMNKTAPGCIYIPKVDEEYPWHDWVIFGQRDGGSPCINRLIDWKTDIDATSSVTSV